MTDQKGNWLHSLKELMDDRNQKKKLLKQTLIYIRLGIRK